LAKLTFHADPLAETLSNWPGRFRFDYDAAVYANEDFVEGFALKLGPLLMTQEVKLLQAAPGGPHP
jgi:hypothetical protein